MLDEKDLQSIAKLISDSEARMTARMAEEISASEARMTARMAEEISASEARMTARMAEEISASEARTAEKISASETQLKDYVDEKVSTAQSHMQALMEGYFDPKFELLGEKIDLLEEKMVTFEDLEDIESRLDALEIVTQQNVREIEKLKMKCPLSSRQNREKEKKGRDYQKMVSVLICLQQPRIPWVSYSQVSSGIVHSCKNGCMKQSHYKADRTRQNDTNSTSQISKFPKSPP